MIKIYIAGPLFNAHERNYLELIASELEGSGYKCFLPHRDQSGIDESELEGTNMSQGTKDKIFNADPCHVYWRATLIYTHSPTHQEFWGHFFDDYPNYHATEQRSNFKFTCRCWTTSLLN